MIRFVRMDEDVKAPHRFHDYDAAFDIYSNHDVLIWADGIAMIKTGLRMSVPIGYVIQILPRSGMASRHGVTVVNAPGLIDPGYRGEVCVSLINLGDVAYHIAKYDRIAQLLVVPYAQASIQEGPLHDPPDFRGEGAFGSTGR